MDQEKIQEMQVLEQNLQNLFMQKQSFQIEFSETQSALKEIRGSGDEVYKMIGQLMVKSDKEKIKEELTNKEKFLEIRLTSVEKEGVAMTMFSPNPAILPSRASIVFFIFEMALFNSIESFCFKTLISITAIV